MSKFFFLLIFALYCPLIIAQENSGYYDKSDIKAIPLLVKNLAKHENVKENFLWFSIDESLYNSTFYKSYIFEGNMNNSGSYRRMDLILTKPYTIEFTKFPGYHVILNPQLPKSQYSKHLFTITKADNEITSSFFSKKLAFQFPQELLSPLKKKDSTLLIINTDYGIEYHNFKGIKIKDITGFEMAPFHINGTTISVTDLKDAKLSFAVKENYDIVFENNELAGFINRYHNVVKRPDEYLSAIQFFGASGLIEMNGTTYKCHIDELDFTENIIAGAIEITVKDKKKFSEDVAQFIKRTSSTPIVKENFKSVMGLTGQMYFNIQQDYKSVYLYFFLLR